MNFHQNKIRGEPIIKDNKNKLLKVAERTVIYFNEKE
jgi:hypothetical protein